MSWRVLRAIFHLADSLHPSGEDFGEVDDFDLGMLAGEEAAKVHEAGHVSTGDELIINTNKFCDYGN